MIIYVYLIYSNKFNKFYTGISSNPANRICEHNLGKLRSSSKFKPYKLVYTKPHDSYKEARKHELWLKKKNHQYKNKLAQLAPPLIGGVKLPLTCPIRKGGKQTVGVKVLTRPK